MADRVGQQLGNYRLIRLLGKGGFAEVYLAEHVYLETQAAIKVLLAQLASEDIEPFRLEAKRVAHLEHPNIVRVLEFGLDGTTPYLAMNYAPNGTLRERHPKGIALPLPTILGYIKQAADALQYAHDEHFIHRDVKPENLLVGRRQEVLLSDFGIALLSQTSRSQSMQDVAGTASYMAPEQFQGKPRPASDQYSLGIIVYEWLTGDRPFHGSFTEIASQHLFVPPPPLHERMPTISPALEQVVLTALAKEPKHRFGSVQAFVAALELASQVAPVIVSPEGRSPQPQDTIPVLHPHQQVIEPLSPTSEALPSTKYTAPSKQTVPLELVTPPNQTSLAPTQVVSSASSAFPSTEFTRPSNPRDTVLETIIPPKTSKRSIPGGRMILFIGLALLVIVASAGAFSLLRSHQLTPDEVTATSIAQNPNPYPPHTGTLALFDPLSDNSKGYKWVESSDCRFIQGMYHASAVGGSITFCRATNTNFSNFTYQVRMTIIKGACGGLIFRAEPGTPFNSFFFKVCQDGGYSFFNDIRNSRDTTRSLAIHTGLNQTNLIAVVANRSNLDLYVNMQPIAHINDSKFSQGQIAVMAYNVYFTLPNEVIYTNATAWIL